MPMIRENMWFGVESVHEHPNVRVYHSKLRLLDEHAVQGAMRNTTIGVDTHGNFFEMSGFSLLVLDIRGVTAVEVKAYQATVFKSPIVAWSEIEEQLMPLLYGVRQALTLPVFDVKDVETQQS
jgi:hypothetical protein